MVVAEQTADRAGLREQPACAFGAVGACDEIRGSQLGWGGFAAQQAITPHHAPSGPSG
jgi:hypothetical protein